MPTKRDVKAIISKQSLTGKEAARLIISHLVETDHGRERLLTQGEIQQIRANVGRMPDSEIEIFNGMMELYRIVGYTLKEAEVLYLEIRVDLLQAINFLQPVEMAWRLRHEQYVRPIIVTRKQLDDLRGRARERKLQELHGLNQVIYWRAIATDERIDEGGLTDEEFDKLWHQAAAEIQELVVGGKLQPVELEIRADDDRLRYGEERPDGTESIDHYDSSAASDVPPEEVDRQLRHYVSGEQLYQSGLPEWQKWIDEYDHQYQWETLHLPEVERGSGVAVLEEPVEWPVELDDRGYYKAKNLVELCDLPLLEKISEEDGHTHKQLLQNMHRTIRKKLRVLLAHQPILEALSDLIGVKLDEDMEAWTEGFAREVSLYKSTLELPTLRPVRREYRRAWREEPEWLERKPELPSFTIDDLKPDPKHVQHLKERMSLPLDKEADRIFNEWFAERCEEIDTTEDRLAEEVRESASDD